MPQLGWVLYLPNEEGEIVPEKYDFESVIAWSKTYPENFHYMPGMLMNMARSSQERGFISPSLLPSCPRQVALKRLVDYYVPLHHQWATYRGTLAHTMMENEWHEDTAVMERRISYNIDVDGKEYVLSGQPDLIVTLEPDVGGGVILVDYKTIKELESKPKSAWIWQTNVYAEMLRQNNVNVTRIFIQQIGMAEPRRTEIPIRPAEAVQNYIRGRVRLLAPAYEATMETLPPMLNEVLNPGQMWLCNSGWCPVEKECRAAHAAEQERQHEQQRQGTKAQGRKRAASNARNKTVGRS